MDSCGLVFAPMEIITNAMGKAEPWEQATRSRRSFTDPQLTLVTGRHCEEEHVMSHTYRWYLLC